MRDSHRAAGGSWPAAVDFTDDVTSEGRGGVADVGAAGTHVDDDVACDGQSALTQHARQTDVRGDRPDSIAAQATQRVPLVVLSTETL